MVFVLHSGTHSVRDSSGLDAHKSSQGFLILTDIQVAVNAIESVNKTVDRLLASVHRTLRTCTIKAAITIQWIPGHCGTDGNKKANKEANDARKIDQAGTRIEWRAAKARLRRKRRKKWVLEVRHKDVYGAGISRKRDKPKREDTLVVQIRASHVPRSAYYRKRFQIDPGGEC